MMIPVAIIGYYFHASDIEDNIIDQINPKSILSIISNILITSHLLFAFVIIQNPIAQKIEIPFKIERFGMKRILVRGMISISSESNVSEY